MRTAPFLAFASTLAALALAGTTRAADTDTFQPEPGFVSLFNGRDLTGWGYAGAAAESFDGKTISSDGRYEAIDGIIRVNERVPRMIQTAATRREFPADFVLRLEFRAGVAADSGVFIRGVQVQCRDYFAVGPFYDATRYRPQEWNTLEVTVRGPFAYATCNGQAIEPSLRIPATGTIGLEGDLGVMEFRRIRIQESPAGRPAGAAAAAARPGPLDPAAFNRPVRLAMLGDEITQPSTGFTTTMGRGGVTLPEATTRQQAAANAMLAASARQMQAVADARTALVASSLSTPAVAPSELASRAAALAAAEQALAAARADVFSWLQASPHRLGAPMAAALVQQAAGAGRGGGRGGAAAAAPGMVQPTDYPSQLGGLLGPRWDVRNFGVGGASVQRAAASSYWNQAAHAAALAFEPDAVVMLFGTHDSSRDLWRADTFVADYKALIALFASLPSPPAIWIAKPPPAFSAAGGADGSVIAGALGTAIDTIARETGARVIDLHAPMRTAAHLTLDGVHPDAEGARAIAAAVHSAIANRP